SADRAGAGGLHHHRHLGAPGGVLHPIGPALRQSGALGPGDRPGRSVRGATPVPGRHEHDPRGRDAGAAAMIRPRAAVGTVLVAFATHLAASAAIAAMAPPPEVSRLAFRHVASAAPGGGLLAQRVIERDWGPSEDSVYVELD